MRSGGTLATRLLTNSMRWSIETERLDDTLVSICALSLQEEIKRVSGYKKKICLTFHGSKQAMSSREIFAFITPVTFFSPA